MIILSAHAPSGGAALSIDDSLPLLGISVMAYALYADDHQSILPGVDPRQIFTCMHTIRYLPMSYPGSQSKF